MPLVEEFSSAGGLAVFDDDVVVDPIEADEHIVATGDKRTFIISCLIVDVVSCVIAVVQIEVTSVIVAYCAALSGVVADHADVATGKVNVVGAVFVNIVVEARLFNVYDVVLVAAQVEGHASRIYVFSCGLHFHTSIRRYQISL